MLIPNLKLLIIGLGFELFIMKLQLISYGDSS